MRSGNILRAGALMAITLAAFASCVKDDSGNEIINNLSARIPVQFSAADLFYTPGTRTESGGDTWINGDRIGVFMVEHPGGILPAASAISAT
jgi:hypothetical protein